MPVTADAQLWCEAAEAGQHIIWLHTFGERFDDAAKGRPPWALAAAVCLSRVYLGAHFPVDVAAGAGLGLFIGSALNLVFGVPSASTAGASG